VRSDVSGRSEIRGKQSTHRPLGVELLEIANPEILGREGEESSELVLLSVALGD
jgi:hypothetical protein